VDKKSFIRKNSSHTKNQLNGYNITSDINGRPVHTTRTYGPYGQKKHCMQCFFPYGPYVRPVRTGVGTHCPYVRVVCTGLNFLNCAETVAFFIFEFFDFS